LSAAVIGRSPAGDRAGRRLPVPLALQIIDGAMAKWEMAEAA